MRFCVSRNAFSCTRKKYVASWKSCQEIQRKEEESLSFDILNLDFFSFGSIHAKFELLKFPPLFQKENTQLQLVQLAVSSHQLCGSICFYYSFSQILPLFSFYSKCLDEFIICICIQFIYVIYVPSVFFMYCVRTYNYNVYWDQASFLLYNV